MNVTTTNASKGKPVVRGSRLLILLMLIVGIAGAQTTGATPLISSANNGGSGGSSDTGASDPPYEPVLRGSGYIVSETPESRAAAPTATAEQIAQIDLEHGRTVSRALTVAEVLEESGYAVPQPVGPELASADELVIVPGARLKAW